MRRTIPVAAGLLIIVARTALAQPSEQDPISELQKQLNEMRAQIVAMQNRIATLEGAAETTAPRSQPEAAATGGATAFQFKGLTVTPGGFLSSTALVRTRNENADAATS